MFAYRSPVIRRLKLNDVHPACVSVSLSPVVAEQGRDDMSGPDDAVLYGRLKNSETEFEWFTQSFGGLRNALSWMV